MQWGETLGGYVSLSDTKRILNRCGIQKTYHNFLNASSDTQKNINEEINWLFDEVYSKLPPVAAEKKQQDKDAFKYLSQCGFTHYGSRKATREKVFYGMVLSSLMFSDYALRIPDFLTTEEIKNGFNGIEILTQKFAKQYNANIPKNLFFDRYAWLIHDKDRWLQSYEWCSGPWMPKEDDDLKWDYINLFRLGTWRIWSDLLVMIFTKIKKQNRYFNYYFLISELYVLRDLDDKLNQEGIQFLKLKPSKALIEVWGIPSRTFKRKESDINSHFELVFSPRG